MSPVARVCLLLFTALPVQRVLIGAGIVLAIVAAAVASQAENARGFAVLFPALLPVFVFIVFPTLMASGVLFLTFSAPRTFRLLPRFRGRMFAGLVVTLLVAGAPLAAVFLLSNPAASLQTWSAVAIGALVMTCFTLCWALPLPWLAIGFIVGMPLLQVGVHLAAEAQLGLDYVPAAAAATTAAIWIAFGRWYLHGQTTLRPPALFPSLATGGTAPPPPRRGERWRAWFTDTSDAALQRDGRSILLIGRFPLSLGQQLLVLVLTTIVLAAWIGSFLWDEERPPPPLPYHVFPFMTALIVGAIARRLVTRARFLWLVSGNRERLFATVERQLWRDAIGWPYIALVLGGLAVIFGAHPWPFLVFSTLLFLANTAFVSYVSLMSVRGFRLLEAGAWLVCGTAFVLSVSALLPRAPLYGAVAALTAVLVLLTLAARALARRHWRTIDWLRLRPQKLTTQQARSFEQAH
jgi:hypothetical protein